MNEMKIFESKEFGRIRTIEIDGKTFFVGKDIAEILGYAEPRSTVSKKVDGEDRGVAKIETPSGIQEMTVVNESGLYTLILGSKLPSAKKFKRWVTSEVLPDIRRHGMYARDELLNDPDLLIQVATQYKEEKLKRVQAENQAAALLEELDYSKEWLSIKRVAKMNNVDWQTFKWRKLKDVGIALGYPPKKIFDANYGEVNTYHKDAWEAAYPEYEV